MKLTKSTLKRIIKEEIKNILSEAEGETSQDVAARIQRIPPMMRGSMLDDIFAMMDGDTSMASYYPHVTDLQAFAREILTLLGEI